MGGRFGGYGLYLLKGKPVFTYNLLMLAAVRAGRASEPRSPPGKHTIVFDFNYDGPGIAKGGTGVLKVDGKVRRTLARCRTRSPFLHAADETFDVGVDTRTGVNDHDYQVPFRFNGKIDKLTIKLEPPKLTAEEQKTVQKAVAKAKD